jgi:hypothetical protein
MPEWMMLLRRGWGGRKSRAQGLVEFAIVLPVMLMAIFILIEFARLFHAWIVIENGARQGVRYAVVNEYDPTYCANGANAQGECLLESDKPSARIQSIHDVVWKTSSSIIRVDEGQVASNVSKYFNVVVCDPSALVNPGSTYDKHVCPPSEDPGEPGDKVVIVVEFNHPLIVPLLSSIWPQLRLTSMREATVETFVRPPVHGTPPVYSSHTPVPTNTLGPTKTATSTPLPPTPSIPLCFEEAGYYALHHHATSGNYNIVSAEFHEGHGYPNGMLLDTVIIESVNLKQEAVEDVERITKVQVGWRNGTMQDVLWSGARSPDVTIPIGIEMPIVPVGWLNCGYRGTYTNFYLTGVLTGTYKMTITLYIPEYDRRCIQTAEYYVVPPTAEPPKPTATGPTPTSGPGPTNTSIPSGPTNTPGGPTNTPVPPPDI